MILMQEKGNTSYGNEFRNIKNNIMSICKEDEFKTIQITSAKELEGKSTLAANLAYCFSEEGYKTIIVDFNLYRPSLHRKLRVKNECGISEVLEDMAQVGDVIQIINDNLHIITAGQLVDTITGVRDRSLFKPNMKYILDELTANYDKIIIDTASILGNDGSEIDKKLSSMVDGTIMVFKKGAINRDIALEAKKVIQNSGGKIIGGVLNGVEDNI